MVRSLYMRIFTKVYDVISLLSGSRLLRMSKRWSGVSYMIFTPASLILWMSWSISNRLSWLRWSDIIWLLLVRRWLIPHRLRTWLVSWWWLMSSFIRNLLSRYYILLSEAWVAHWSKIIGSIIARHLCAVW